jgi:hypothetical protein
MKSTISGDPSSPVVAKTAIFSNSVQFDSSSCGLFVVLVPYLLIYLSILRPSCNELQLINFVRHFIHGMHMGQSPNARKICSWLMFAIATNWFVPNRNIEQLDQFHPLGKPYQ